MDGLLFNTAELPAAQRPARPPRRRRKLPAAPVANASWPLERSINVVLFAGVGGACQGLEDAGFPVHVAVNHDKVAIAAHKALNPHTRHLHADIYEVCPLEATGGRPVGILWASPDCRDHSVAKGGAPRSERVRSMPWQICRWAGTLAKHGLGPGVVFLENVREIRGWGPLVAKRDPKTKRVLVATYSRDQRTGKRNPAPLIRVAAPGEVVPRKRQVLVRDRRHAGRTYEAWVAHMRRLGAIYEDRDLCCADYGVPTSRKRLFGIGHFNGGYPVWPERTHAPRKELAKLNAERVEAGLPRLLPHRAAAEIIDWSLPLPSIFDRKKELAPATRKRIAAGMRRFVIEAESPFLIHLTHGGRIHDTDNAAPTVTSAHRGELAVVGAAVVPTTHTKSGDRVHDGAVPTPTLTAGVKGGELAIMGATIIGAGGRAAQVPPMDAAAALNTSTTKEDRCIVAAHVTTFRNGAVGHSMDEPTRTFTTQSSEHHPGGAPPFGLVVAHLQEMRTRSIGADVTDATPTQTAKDHTAVMGAYITRYHGERRPGEARGAEPGSPLPTNTTENRFGVVAATMVQTGYGEREGQAPRALDIESPLGTQVTNGGKHAIIGAYLTQHHGQSIGQPVEQPLGSQTQVPHHAVMAVHLEKFNENSRGQSAEAPIDTIMAGAPRFGVMGTWMVQHNTGVIGHTADEPVSAMTTAGTQQQVAAAYLTELRGTSRDGQPVTAPAGTMCTGGGRGGGHDAVTAAILEPCVSAEDLERARWVAAFLREHGAWDDREFVVIGPWLVVDIGMRMLTPDEAAAAHELDMPAAIEIDGVSRPLTKTEGMRLVGNSVPKRMAMLLAGLNASHALYAPARQMHAAE